MFYLKDKNKESTTVEAVIRFKGQRYKISTGEKVLTAFWNPLKDRCKEQRNYREGPDINFRLDKWEKHIRKVKADFLNAFTVPSQAEFAEAVKVEVFGDKERPESFTGFIARFMRQSHKAPGTIKAYQTTLNWVELYQKEHGELRFSDINQRFYKSFQVFAYKSGVNSPNFFGTLIKNIKMFMNQAKEEGVHQEAGHKSFKRVDVDVENIYLSVEELTRIHRLEITGDMIKEQVQAEEPERVLKPQHIRLMLKALNLARGKFLIGAFTALRVSDFSRIDNLNIKDGFITIHSTAKTGRPVIIPVHWVVKEILDSGFNLSQRISDQKLNKHIKELCKYAGITGPVTLTKFEKGRRKDITKEKWEWVTTHTARRSGATNMYKAGIPTLSIMKITGHRTEKSFLKYIKVTQEENAEILAKHPFFNKG